MDDRKHALIFVFVTVLIDVIGFGLIMPVIPSLLVEITGEGLNAASIWGGWLLLAYAIPQFVFAPVLGNLSDRFGRRPLLLVSLLVYAVNYLIMGFANTLWLLFAGRIITGMASSTYSVANAVIADVTPPESRAQNFGLIGVAFGVGFVLGPTLGGLLGEWDVRAPFFAAAMLAFCNVTYGALVFRETLAPANRRDFDIRRANPVGALRHLQRYPMLYGVLFAMLLYNIGHHVYPANWNFYTMAKFSWSEFDVGLSMGVVGILMALVQGLLIRRVIPLIGPARSAILGFLSAGLAYAGIAFAWNEPVLYGWMVVSAFGGFIMPSVQAIMSTQVPANEQGQLQGIVASMGSVGAIIGPLLMTQLFGYFGAPNPLFEFKGIAFLTAAVLTFAAMLIFLSRVRHLVDMAAHNADSPAG